MDTTASQDAAQAVVAFAHTTIPLARAMQVRLAAYDGTLLALSAPLAANVNDKGCAFGGSLTTLMTLAGWSLVELALRERGVEADIFVADSKVHYRAPVWGELRAEAWLHGDSSWESFFAVLGSRGKARVCVNGQVPGNSGAAATLEARFVAKRRV